MRMGNKYINNDDNKLEQVIKSSKVKKNCEYCGKEFYIVPSMKNQKFCSRECYRNSKTLNKMICPICHKSFVSKYSNQKTCSKFCSSKSLENKITCTCDYCGKEFQRKKSEYEKNKTHFCSKECRYKAIQWNDKDIEILKANYNKISNSKLRDMLSVKHSEKEVRRKAGKLGITRDQFWTKEENQILENNYGRISMEKLMGLLPGRSKDSILGHAYANHILSPSARIQYSNEDVQFIKDNYLIMSNAQLAKKLNRTVDGISLKLYDLGLTRPFDVKATSYPDLEKFVRRRLSPWIDKVREEFNNTCSLSGSQENIEVHHIRSFNLLINETCEILNFPAYDNFNNYTEEQLNIFIDTFLELQENYHAYTCVTKKIHKLFHMEYGYGGNTEGQWNEFSEKYKNGYYDNVR